MKVLKFGGTSVGSPESIGQVLSIIEKNNDSGQQQIVVVSAMTGVTNQLIEMSRLASNGDEQYNILFKSLQQRHFDAIDELIDASRRSEVFLKVKQILNSLEDVLQGVCLLRELSPRALDFVQGQGEVLSASIITAACHSLGLPATFTDARKIIRTDSHYGYAKVDFSYTEQLTREFLGDISNQIPIVTGFIGADKNGITTTLGRGGSDYTASILAASLGADVVEIWTDVDGVLTTDPRKVKEAFSLKALSYQEAMELSHFGAKVIYPPTLQPVFSRKIPIYIRNTFKPDFPGTRISEETSSPNELPVKGISSINDIALINVQGSGMVGVAGTSSRLFDALGKSNVNIILITQASSEHSICFAIQPEEAETAREAIEEAFHYELADGKLDPINIERGLAIIALIGDNMRQVPGVSGRMFGSLGQNGINIRAIAQGSSERNISVVIEQGELTKALNALHDAFFLSDTQSINLFVVGHGLVGKELLDQIQSQYNYLLQERHIRLNLVALANRKKMLFNPAGISIPDWQESLEIDGQPSDIQTFVEDIIRLNMPNSIFVDNTSDREIVQYYPQILQHNIHIVTPNKTATSESYETYQSLRRISARKGVKFLYETNVGAGLPVINTLQDLIHSGDKIISIEGVFSGTLSYIFNHYDGQKSFAAIVREAQDLGYTEPDPREDLSGQDVARKILILAREAGFALEPSEVEVVPLLPARCLQASNVDDFYKVLEEEEDTFRKQYQDAQSNNQKLRVVASLKEGKATVQLQSCGVEHPFFGLSGSDNMIAYTTRRYARQPLVVRGPGAGAAVTAAGVFADIIRTINR